jgi:predicted AlkP superfamily pyrophosphatase or phosphodiesterase
MKRILISVCLAASLLAAAPKKPKLVVAIVIDQFRYDYVTRFRNEYTAGFDRLLTKGALFSNANYIHSQTVTAVGHSTFLTGATPSVSGIVGNDWFDREERKHVTSVSDRLTRLLGGAAQSHAEGASPRRLLVSTVGDELKMAHGATSHVIGISLKDRAAILPAGHMANGAYWFDLDSGNFVSSTYYFSELPAWVKEFNDSRPSEKYRGVSWIGHRLPMDLRQLYSNSDVSPLESSPFGNELVEMLAERALSAEQLGKHDSADLLTVSFSSNDKVGHDYGTYSAEEHEITVRTDKVLDKLFQALDRQVGLDNVLIVLTGDHGVAPSPEEDAANHMPGGRLPSTAVKDAIQAALARKYGEGEWVAGSWELVIYLNHDLIAKKNLDPAEVRRAAAEAAYGVAHMMRVYTRDQLLTGSVIGDETSRRVMNGYNVKLGADIVYLPEPYWIFTKGTTTHGTPFGYDAHVPVIFLGQGVRAGRYDAPVTVNDIAPTLATMLEVETPSGSVGRVLAEMFAQ